MQAFFRISRHAADFFPASPGGPDACSPEVSWFHGPGGIFEDNEIATFFSFPNCGLFSPKRLETGKQVFPFCSGLVSLFYTGIGLVSQYIFPAQTCPKQVFVEIQAVQKN